MSGSKSQKGFTLIEVSLAIVIGVIVLAGAITLYNQTKMSAGNSKAGEKTLALGSLVEEMGASNYGVYPTVSQLHTAWRQRRDDAAANPWGGSMSGAAIAESATISTAAWNTTVTTGAGKNAPLYSNIASTGQMIYIRDNRGPALVYDTDRLRAASFSQYVVGIADSRGDSMAFVTGGK